MVGKVVNEISDQTSQRRSYRRADVEAGTAATG
jgi:hypothetical protein